ncbi:MAG: helicase-associated domain-containing protein, partial [Chloroflexota bacterium]
ATTLKKNNITRLVPALRDEQRIRRNLAGLNEVEKLAVGIIHEQGDEMASDHLRSLLTHEGVLKTAPAAAKVFVGYRQVDWYEGNPHYKGQPAYEDLMAGLALKGLVLSREPLRQDRGVIEWTPGQVLFIPAFIARHLPAAPAQPAGSLDKGEPPFVLPGSARNFQRDLSHYARFLRRQKELPLTSQGLVYKKTLKEVAAGLSFPVDLGSGKAEEENGRLFFLRRLLPHLGLAEAEWNRLLPSALDENFWKLGPSQRVQKTFETWRDGVVWNELRQLAYYERGSDRTADAPPALSASRQAILRHVKGLGSGWIRLPDLIAHIRRKDYGFLFAKRKYDSYGGWGRYNDSTPYSQSNNPLGMGFGGIQSEVDGWNKVEAGFINHVIAGPLFWMGLVDLGYKGEPAADLNGTAPALAYHLTDMGAWLLGLRGQVEISHQQSGGLVVQPNFEILVMEPIADEVLLVLDQFAESKGGDRVLTYELTRASVYRGQRHEWPVGRIIPYLESSAKQPLPANVRRTLEEWEALHQRIIIRRRVNLAQT